MLGVEPSTVSLLHQQNTDRSDAILQKDETKNNYVEVWLATSLGFELISRFFEHRGIASVVCLHVALSGLYKSAVIHSFIHSFFDLA
jgi:hypothetical protein